jgi:hypothetical protein
MAAGLGDSWPIPTRVTVHMDIAGTRIYSDYDPEIRNVIKSIAGRRWNPEHKYWTVPYRSTVDLVDLLRGRGFHVILEQGFTPGVTQPGYGRATTNPWDLA